VTKSLAELESEDAEFRAAKANAEAEVARLRDCRKAVLLSGDIDKILSLDAEVRRQEITGEIANAKSAKLRGPIYFEREELKRWAGVIMPSDAELSRLLDIVLSAHPNECRNAPKEFKRAFYSVGRLGRLSEPSSDRYYASSLDDANEVLRAHRLEDINGDLLWAAALAWGDICWRGGDKALGQLSEIGLARIGQGVAAKPMWRKILSGEASLVTSLPPRNVRASSSTYSVPRVTIRYGDGREVDPASPLGVQ
jgi:hypothetical protein